MSTPFNRYALVIGRPAAKNRRKQVRHDSLARSKQGKEELQSETVGPKGERVVAVEVSVLEVHGKEHVEVYNREKN